MTEIEGHHEDDCLMCAVRALTEGRAKEWNPEEPAEVTGVILHRGTQPTHFSGSAPFVELWLGGRERVRVTGHAMVLGSLIEGAELQVGDTVTIRYTGKKEAKLTPSQARTGKAANTYKTYDLEVRRGHR
jgi:hypothetical protein